MVSRGRTILAGGLLAFATIVVAVTPIGCGEDGEQGGAAAGGAGANGGGGSGGEAEGGNSTGGNGTGGSGTGGSGTGGSGTGGSGGGNTGGGGDGGGACSIETHVGERQQLDLHIMLDRSSSMSGSGKWTSMTAALQNFVSAPESAGTGMGLAYFPVPWSTQPTLPDPCADDAACGLYGPCLPNFFFCAGSLQAESCDPVDYASADVPVGLLPGISATLLASLNSNGPNGATTPSQPALEGAISYATTWQQANQDHRVAVVLATDGQPTNCTDNTLQGAADAALQAATADPPLLTYVLGIGSNLSALNLIAQAGGTAQAYLVDINANATQQLTDALTDIRAAHRCSYQIPMPQQGPQDFGLVNVVVVDGNDPNNTALVLQVASDAACDPIAGGWYYDDPSDPMAMVLCQSDCDEVALSGWEVTVELGCPTNTQ